MKPARFDYVRPDNLPAALEILARHGSDAAVLAGGQSLIPMLNLRLAGPSVLIDINRIPDLDLIVEGDGFLELGSRARHNDVLRSPMVRRAAPLLPQALQHVAHEAVRNRGTLGGSLVLADPAAELPACVVCLEAQLVAASVRGERIISAADFFQGLYTTDLAPDELLRAVRVPTSTHGWRFAFEEVARRHGDFAMAGLALAAHIQDSRIRECRAVFTGIEPAPKRALHTESLLKGQKLSEHAILLGAQADLERDLEPMEGGAYPAEYRLHLAFTLLTRAIKRIAGDSYRDATRVANL